ncbi:MAG: UDP-3-O-(3-hydroxymyristoyl)glucosamine N-acyltransferase [Calditrichaeota bacterium]|nr:UDP-3-O-(3-hydroxymyristoyl)glucosamine N-acyltransferase [Calditrichota bacterium]
MPVTLAEVAKWIGGTVDGDDSIKVSALAKIEEAKSGQLTFIANPKYARFIDSTKASAVLVDLDFPKSAKPLIRVSNPYFAFLTLAKKFYHGVPSVEKGVHPSVVLGENCKLGQDVAIGAHVVIGQNCIIGPATVVHPGVVIGDDVQIGADCLLYANVSIREQCRIGNNVIVQMGAVIGSDGFGFAFEGGKYHKLPQMGIVVIEDDVEIGANSAIDRATMGETIIRRGTKIDNLVQIAHNVEIDEHTAIAAQCGISGSTKIGKYVKMGGQAGLVGHITIGDYAAVGGQGGVTKSVPEKTFVSGYPAREHLKVKREEASLAKLPELIKKFRRLEAEVKELQGRLMEKGQNEKQ